MDPASAVEVSAAPDWGPLGKHPDLEAIADRQRLHLPLSGRLTEAEVTAAWKNAAGDAFREK